MQMAAAALRYFKWYPTRCIYALSIKHLQPINITNKCVVLFIIHKRRSIVFTWCYKCNDDACRLACLLIRVLHFIYLMHSTKLKKYTTVTALDEQFVHFVWFPEKKKCVKDNLTSFRLHRDIDTLHYCCEELIAVSLITVWLLIIIHVIFWLQIHKFAILEVHIIPTYKVGQVGLRSEINVDNSNAIWLPDRVQKIKLIKRLL